ncbi:phosphoesterase family protein [hydrocarbon metagenome]|uniref:Phosphoesterase family protein n=1 Tax=hydrocarbon metagenome TaxID=938273 RepID=A0A0W8G649_9ZZZZ
MRILFLGDIVGRPGRDAVVAGLFRLRRECGADVVLANGENASGGLGITVKAASQLLSCGVDVITSGNHIFKHREIQTYFDGTDRLLRPANYPPGAPGTGLGVYRPDGTPPYAVINLLGRTYMDSLDCPFRTADALIGRIPGDVAVRVLDFHAEATSEKKAMAYYLDGRVSALCGTHTHVQTSDAQILPHGMAYITDLGMSGPIRSAIGMDPQAVIRRYLTGMPQRFVLSKGPVELQGAVIDIDAQTGKAVQIQAWRQACQE